ncbi:MAG: deoxyguanosinetriphosphate triphosphohydrolase-like protein [Methanomassiliicoccales archaeon PtaU1.Bin124]|nr:MAG: deoxyguanosinetriphosphate triphosphohydrolase-like protein [Methanomassiliicoccales archaeon PtaU1.Bin124]
MESKIIHDAVHGSVKVDSFFVDLMHRPEVQRLHGVNQLGLAYLVFPGAHHTRMEHSLGTFYLAGRMADALGLNQQEKNTVRAAALLHDIGHAPYSHTLEAVIEHRTGMTHTDVGKAMISGDMRVWTDEEEEVLGPMGTIGDMLVKNGIDPEEVADIIVSPVDPNPHHQSTLPLDGGQAHFNSNNYLHQIIHGPVDADQMDYLLRDAHYTGVAHGTIDLDRLIDTMELHNGDLTIRKNGLVAVEGLMVARSLMYTSVYFHKTVRISEMMLCKAVEHASDSIMDGMHRSNDAALQERLLAEAGHPRRLLTMLKYRRLYKKAFSLNINDLDEDQLTVLSRLTEYERRRAKEQEIADKANLDEVEVIVDMPSKEMLLTEPRLGKTEVPIWSEGKVRSLSKYSPLAKAIQQRPVNDWAIMVYCPEQYKERVHKATSLALFR